MGQVESIQNSHDLGMVKIAEVFSADGHVPNDALGVWQDVALVKINPVVGAWRAHGQRDPYQS
jgi:hypothetical protein